MTIERLEELNDIKEQIVDLKEYIDTLSGINYDYFEVNGRYKGDRNADFIFSFNNMEKHALHPLTDITPLVCDGLQEVIISFLKEKLAKLEKEFEEA
jgi:hypothetical protein